MLKSANHAETVYHSQKAWLKGHLLSLNICINFFPIPYAPTVYLMPTQIILANYFHDDLLGLADITIEAQELALYRCSVKPSLELSSEYIYF